MGNIQNSLIGNQIGLDILLAGSMVAASNDRAGREIAASNDRVAIAQYETNKEISDLKKTLEAQALKAKADAEAYYKEYRSLTEVKLQKNTNVIIKHTVADDLKTYRTLKYNDCQVIEKACNVGVEGNHVRILTLHDLYFDSYFDIRVDTDSYYNINNDDIIYLDKNTHVEVYLINQDALIDYNNLVKRSNDQTAIYNTAVNKYNDKDYSLKQERGKLNRLRVERDAINTGNKKSLIILGSVTALLLVLTLLMPLLGTETAGGFGIFFSIMTMLFGVVTTALLVKFGQGLKNRAAYRQADDKCNKQVDIVKVIEKEQILAAINRDEEKQKLNNITINKVAEHENIVRLIMEELNNERK